ncbi:MAG: hypothetical protein IH606_19230 [Burkholderiales bacterium]|nr:hypothetical protein [Burkholderiales bacterium]
MEQMETMETMEQMEQALVLCSRWAMLVDSTAAQSAIDRISKLNLPRRICRPLDRDRRREQGKNAELEKFDAAIEAAIEAEAASELELAAIEPVHCND